ncbi:hypothetical protein AC626_15655 [Pseudoalteromonas rubra]|uniref:L-rhamnose mutarotase n=1 Tax=Pseudoalteromonas rubra TaxID=43658 RepID=A0A0L0EQG6_9GAMM|nr:hypothetical protein AC626_15655 [Pseudoalteromonas rubra]
MKTYGFTIKLRNEAAKERYFQYHKSVWPEVHDALDDIGVRSVQIFFMDELTLFMHMETENDFVPYDSFAAAMGLHPRVQGWDDIMHMELLERWPENDSKTEWAVMNKIYHYDTRDVEIEGVDR